jgi:uncharacterized caspase-like protein
MAEMAAGQASGARRALVIGIDDYADEDHDLPSCVADARTMTALLRNTFGFEVTQLLDGAAQLDRVRGALGVMLDGLRPEDRAVLYYSGHGARTVRDGVQTESLVMQDFQLLHDDVVVAATRGIPHGVLTVVLDACFSGGLWKRLDSTRRKSLSFTAKDVEAPRAYRPFGGPTRLSHGVVIDAISASVVPASKTDEPTLNGLLFSACLETETAAASTPETEGKSAFTYALTRALAAQGDAATPADLLPEIRSTLQQLGLVQAPQLHPPAAPPGMERHPLFDRGVPVVRGTGTIAITPAIAPADPLLRIVYASLAAFAATH